MLKRRRFHQTKSLQDRLAAWAEEVREQAAKLPPGPERDALLKKLRQADTAPWTTGPTRPDYSRRHKYPQHYCRERGSEAAAA